MGPIKTTTSSLFPHPFAGTARPCPDPQEASGATLAQRSRRFINSLFSSREDNYLSALFTPKKLNVLRLPDPPFNTDMPPPRYFWHRGSPVSDIAEPSPLFQEFLEEDPVLLENTADLLSLANAKIPHKGILRKDSKGIVYLDVPDDFIELLLPEIPEEGIERPPYFTYEGPLGAHCPVLLPHEYSRRKGLGKIEELGKEIPFKITGCYSIAPQNWPEMEKVWYLTLSCPEIETLREKSLLPLKIHSHDFHIAIGVKRASHEARAVQKNTLPVFRINISCQPV